MIEQVQCLGSKLELNPFGYRERLEQAEIHVIERRPDQIVAARGPESCCADRSPGTISRAIDAEYGTVEIRVSDTNASENIDLTGDLVGILSAPSRLQRRCRVLYNAERRTAHGADDRVDLPSADQKIHCSALVPPMLSLTKRQIINAVDLKVVLAMVSRKSLVSLLLREILDTRVCVVVSIIDGL